MTTLRQFHFTQRGIDALPAHVLNTPSCMAEYSDIDVTGLRLLISSRGRKWFYFRASFQGHKRTVRLGEYPVLGLQEARRLAWELRATMDKGVDPSALRDQQRTIPLFADFALQDYMPHARTHKRSADSDLSKLRVHLIPAFGQRRLSMIGVRDIQRYLANLRQSHSPATVNRHLSLLSKLFSCAVQWDLLEYNPCRGLTKFTENNACQRFLTVEEIRQLFQCMDRQSSRSGMTVAALKFLLLTGTRKNEALRARWEHVDLERGILLIPQTKNGKSHHVLLNEQAQDLLRTLPRQAGSPWVFPGRDASRPITEVRHCLNLLARDAGIPALRVHDLRHTFASLCAQSGASLLQIKQLLNHASLATTQRYAHLRAEDLRAASHTVSEVVGRVRREGMQ